MTPTAKSFYEMKLSSWQLVHLLDVCEHAYANISTSNNAVGNLFAEINIEDLKKDLVSWIKSSLSVGNYRKALYSVEVCTYEDGRKFVSLKGGRA